MAGALQAARFQAARFQPAPYPAPLMKTLTLVK